MVYFLPLDDALGQLGVDGFQPKVQVVDLGGQLFDAVVVLCAVGRNVVEYPIPRILHETRVITGTRTPAQLKDKGHGEDGGCRQDEK
jgi:hypothetical protein